MKRKLFAFDLDGTLLNSKKELSEANLYALKEMAASGAVVAFASGRLGSSMMRYVPLLGFDVAMLTLNGAAVFSDSKNLSNLLYDAPLPATFADQLIDYSAVKSYALNYYIHDKLYSVSNGLNEEWLDLYFKQTHTEYHMLSTFDEFKGANPSKIIFVGNPKEMDEQEAYFNSIWNGSVYICRTWDYYLEFLSMKANKGNGLEALANSYNIDIKDVIAFGDAVNDIPMLKKAGFGVAVKNAHPDALAAAHKVSMWSNDEDAVAKEWAIIKGM